MTTLRRLLVLPAAVAAVLSLAGCPTPEIDMRVPGAPAPESSLHHRPPAR